MARAETQKDSSFVIVKISESVTNWTPYVSASDAIQGTELDFGDDSLWYYPEDRRSPDQIFDDKHLVHALMSAATNSGINPLITFKAERGIQVYDSIAFKAGFHGSSRNGVMAVNGVDMLELEAWDRTPQEFVINVKDIPGFTGTLESISIRQKELETQSQVGAPALADVFIDGNQLLNDQKATVIEFEPGADLDKIKVGSVLEQLTPQHVWGRVSAVLPEENKVILDEIHEGFAPGSDIHVIESEYETKADPAIQDTDWLIVNRGGKDYKYLAKDLKDQVSIDPPAKEYKVVIVKMQTMDKSYEYCVTQKPAKHTATEFALVEKSGRQDDPPLYAYRYEITKKKNNFADWVEDTSWTIYDGTAIDLTNYPVSNEGYAFRLVCLAYYDGQWLFDYVKEDGSLPDRETSTCAMIEYPVVCVKPPVIRGHVYKSRTVDMDLAEIHKSGDPFNGVHCHYSFSKTDLSALDGIDPEYESDRPKPPVSLGPQLHSDWMYYDGNPDHALPPATDDEFWRGWDDGDSYHDKGLRPGSGLVCDIWFETSSWGHAYRYAGVIVESGGKPWDDIDGIYHVIVSDPNDIEVADHTKIFDLSNDKEVSDIAKAGEFIVAGDGTKFWMSKGNWTFGNLTDTSKVTNMDRVFWNCINFNSDISDWDTSNVTNMHCMFGKCLKFNCDIGEWDVGNVQNMAGMFGAPDIDYDQWAVGNTIFNQDIGNWNVSNVTDMNGMFRENVAFNQDISKWDMTKSEPWPNEEEGTDVRWMFAKATAFNKNLAGWDMSHQTNLYFLFNQASSFNQDIGVWDTSKVHNMDGMFRKAVEFNQDLTQWCVEDANRGGPPSHFLFDDGATKFEGKNKPQWGTCPRGENA